MQYLKLIILGFLISFSAQSFAGKRVQDKFDYEKFKSEKIAFFTDALDLTPDEAAVFWPVYNEYEKKKWELMKERRQFEKDLDDNDLDKLSEEECIALTRKFSSLPQEDAELNKEYNEKFLKVLPAQKVVKLYITEMDFRHHMLRKYRDKDDDKGKRR
ncbi:MAG: hypothetical protein K9G70_14670 [Prolixibacteraceae bacterium]|nr:hypothetical protein [Prolixibacteraceae bacterium]